MNLVGAFENEDGGIGGIEWLTNYGDISDGSRTG